MGLQWDNKISLGHLLTAIGMLLAMMIAWSDLQREQALQSSRLTTVEEALRNRIAEADNSDANTDTRLRSLEVSGASFSADLRNIQIGISRIETALEELKRKSVK
jgi:hypothetical protein